MPIFTPVSEYRINRPAIYLFDSRLTILAYLLSVPPTGIFIPPYLITMPLANSICPYTCDPSAFADFMSGSLGSIFLSVIALAVTSICAFIRLYLPMFTMNISNSETVRLPRILNIAVGDPSPVLLPMPAFCIYGDTPSLYTLSRLSYSINKSASSGTP